MISRIIEWCERNRFLVFTGVVFLVIAGVVVRAAYSAGRAARYQRCAGRDSYGMGGRTAERD